MIYMSRGAESFGVWHGEICRKNFSMHFIEGKLFWQHSDVEINLWSEDFSYKILSGDADSFREQKIIFFFSK